MHTTITEENLREFVETFYGRIQQNEVIGPVFTNHIEDWEPLGSQRNFLKTLSMS